MKSLMEQICDRWANEAIEKIKLIDIMQISKNQSIHIGEDYNSEDYRIYNRKKEK